MSIDDAGRPGINVVLRDVEADDIAFFYEHQLDQDACRMAAFPSRDRAAFGAHWEKVLAADDVIARTVEVDGEVAGYICSFTQHGKREVGYWIGRTFWGRGVATGALAPLLEIEPERPLHAEVAERNLGSRRVLEKCGFVRIGQEDWRDGETGDAILGLVYELGAT
jgi:RimJ/RimL family protein N-acetyltransferase